MIVRRTEASTHAVLAIDADRRVVEDMPAVPTAEVAVRIHEIRTRCGATVRILVDGVALIDGRVVVGAALEGRRLGGAERAPRDSEACARYDSRYFDTSGSGVDLSALRRPQPTALRSRVRGGRRRRLGQRPAARDRVGVRLAGRAGAGGDDGDLEPRVVGEQRHEALTDHAGRAKDSDLN